MKSILPGKNKAAAIRVTQGFWDEIDSKSCSFLHTSSPAAHFRPRFPHVEPLPSLSDPSLSVYLQLHLIEARNQRSMFGKTLYGSTFKDVNFVPLQSATFCVQCEMISTNSKPYCLACGSHAVLGLSRVVGGSLRHQQTAHLITDTELNNLVRDLLRTVPDPDVVSLADHFHMPPLAPRSQLRVANAAHPLSRSPAVSAAQIHLPP